MTLHEAIGVNVDTDVKTGEKLDHSEIYGRAIELLGGLDTVAEYIPFSLDRLQEAYRTDKHFNNLYLGDWDRAAGFRTNPFNGKCLFMRDGIWNLYRRHGITSASCADGVCVLKEAARRLVERKEKS